MAFKRTINILILLMIFISFAKCSLFSVKSTVFFDDELKIFEKSLNSLEYGYGYDYDMELYYIYSYSYSKDNFDKKEKAFAEVINSADYKTVINIYERILKMQAVTDYKINKYKTEPRWKYYTFIKNDLHEPLNTYSALMLKYILKKNPSLSQFFEMKKASVNSEITKEYTKKEEITDTF
ncbi:MAG: hypothetical protein JXN64_08295 [Spirochaetes bacterium]|nr:hypothetical protein [Spirochaetota bacterium]